MLGVCGKKLVEACGGGGIHGPIIAQADTVALIAGFYAAGMPKVTGPLVGLQVVPVTRDRLEDLAELFRGSDAATCWDMVPRTKAAEERPSVQGVTAALLDAASSYAYANCADALEAYPRPDADSPSLAAGSFRTVRLFAKSGFEVVRAPIEGLPKSWVRRYAMRRWLRSNGPRGHNPPREMRSRRARDGRARGAADRDAEGRVHP